LQGIGIGPQARQGIGTFWKAVMTVLRYRAAAWSKAARARARD